MMNGLLTDLHTHLCLSTPDEMISAAQSMGVPELGISEHDYQIRELRDALRGFPPEGTFYPLEDYLAVFQAYASDDLRLYRGYELDILPGYTEKAVEMLGGVPWDYVIGSLHEMDGWDIHWEHHFSMEEQMEKWRQNLRIQREWVETEGSRILGHPTRMAITIPDVPDDFEERLMALCRAAKAHGVAVEINTRDYRISPKRLFALIRCCAVADCMVTMGSDAHRPEDIARDFVPVTKILREAGVRETFVFSKGQPVGKNLD